METTPHISPKADSRVVWLDVVRLIAMFTVVCCHCTDPFNFYPGTAPNIEDIKFLGAVYGAVLRPCVPLFVMITELCCSLCVGMHPYSIRNVFHVCFFRFLSGR